MEVCKKMALGKIQKNLNPKCVHRKQNLVVDISDLQCYTFNKFVV